VRWRGASGEPELSQESRSLAYFLSGASVEDDDLYVMINGGEADLDFSVQDGRAGEWLRAVDTSLSSPEDVSEPGREPRLASLQYRVGSRSVVVLRRLRTRGSGPRSRRPASSPAR